MTGTVKERIIEAIIAAIEGLDSVGMVEEPGSDTPAEIAKTIGPVSGGGLGKIAVELVIGDDEPADEPSEIHSVETVEFGVDLIGHLPDPLPDGQRWSGVAAGFHGDVQTTYANKDDPLVGTWGELAVQTKLAGGGGVGISDLGTHCTVSAFTVTYRYTSGDPTEVR